MRKLGSIRGAEPIFDEHGPFRKEEGLGTPAGPSIAMRSGRDTERFLAHTEQKARAGGIPIPPRSAPTLDPCRGTA
jgi:hypothetical protein